MKMKNLKSIRKHDRFLTLFLAFCLIFTAMIPPSITPAHAATTYKVKCTDSGLNYGAGSQSTFERSDGTAVYCGEHDVYSPVEKGDTTSLSFSLYTKSKTVIKALYYGKGGPKEWSGFDDYTTKQAKCITALALSNAYIDSGDAKSAAVKVDLDEVKGLKAFWNYIKGKTTPASDRFEVYRYAGDAWTQSLFTFEYHPKGDGTLVKQSSHSFTTNANGYYLKDAEYGVYQTKADAKADRNRAGTMKTVAGGTSNTLTLDVGTYYVKETKAPKGYALDDTIHTLKIKEDETTKLTVEDIPEKGSLQIIKKSADSDTADNANYSLANAEFKVYRDKEKKNFVTTLTTDKNGKTKEFTCIADTYYIYETKAPKGFKLYDGVITAKVTIGQETEKTVKEEPIPGSIQIVKEPENPDLMKNNENYTLQGAVFGVYSDAACSNLLKEMITDDEGKTEVFALYASKYYIKELKAPEGFKINTNVFAADVCIGQKVIVNVNEKEETGFAKVKKVVSGKKNAELVAFCPQHYTLEGAVYGLYTTERDAAEGKEPAKTLVTNDQGETDEIELPLGKYWVKELKPSKGYLLDENVYPVIVNANKTATITSVEKPVFDRLSVMVKKADENQPDQYLSDAEFTIRYYPDLYDDVNGKIAIREWKFKSDENGCIRLCDQDYIGGDSLFRTDDGETVGLIGTYEITETKAPDGYLLNPNKIIRKMTISEEGTALVYQTPLAVNTPQTVKINLQKVDQETGKRVPQGLGSFAGAVYQILQLDEKTKMEFVLDTLTTDIHGKASSKLLKAGRYIVREIKAPAGYTVNHKDIEIDAEITDGTTKTFDYHVQSEEVPTTTEVQKVDSKTTGFVKGAVLAIYDTDGKEIDKWTTTDQPHVFKALPAGTYTLKELSVPPGYVKADPVEFEVKETGEVQKIVMEDDYIKVEIVKIDATSGKQLAGVTLRLLDEKENVIDEWVTDGKPHRMDKLPAGDYILREITTLDGYYLADDVKFTVKETAEVQTITMKNDYTKVEISKTDLVTGAPVIGAKLQILDADGKEVVSFITTDKPYYIEKLQKGKYTLVETYAPDEYVTANAVDFVVEETGEIQKVNMEDDHTKIQLMKVDAGSGNPIPDTTLALIPLDKDGKPLEDKPYLTETTDEEGKISAEYIPKGKYVLREIKTNFDAGYVTADDMVIEIRDTEELQIFTMKDDYTKLQISKLDLETGAFVEGASLQIINKDDEVVCEWKSGDGPKTIEKLPVGAYTLVEKKAPAGYVKTEPINFELRDTEEMQYVEMKDDFIKVEIYKVESGTELPVEGAELMVYDDDGEEIAAFTTTRQPYRLERLPEGDYTLQEVAAPAGYEKAEDVQFTVAGVGQPQKVVMEDKPVISEKVPVPETGDHQSPGIWGLFAFGSLCCIIWVMTRRKEGLKHDKEDNVG